MHPFSTLHATLLTLVFVTATAAAPPVGWRYDGSGKFPAANPPVNWTAERNVIWRQEMPGRSLASPIVVGQRVFVTAEPAELVCLSTSNGKKLWQQSHQYNDIFDKAKAAQIERDLAEARKLGEEVNSLHRERDTARKPNDDVKQKQLERRIDSLRNRISQLTVFPPLPGGDTANTGSTPTSDGKNVFAVFGTGIVSSHTLSGKRNWSRFIEAPGSGHCASPLLVDGKLIVHLRNLIGLNPATGKTLWTAETGARHGSPVAARVDGMPVVVTPDGAIVRTADGRILAKQQFQLNHSSPIADDGVVYATQDGSIKAVTLASATAEEAVTQVAWETSGSRSSRLASPLYDNGLLYSVTEQGILEVTDAETGKRIYRKRLEFDGGRVDPSVTMAGNQLYVSNTRGETVVFRSGPKYQELARCKLPDGFSSSLVFADDRLYIRTPKTLYCIEQAPSKDADKPGTP